VSYTYVNAEAGPIGPSGLAGHPYVLERDGKLSFMNEKIHDRFLKLRALGLDH
jgi:hypothetical protein